MKRWDGREASGRYQYPMDQVEEWDMLQADNGTIYYAAHDGSKEYKIWCPGADLTRHIHHLEQIKAR